MTEYPNSINFKEITIGYSKKFTVKITSKMLEDFASLSGDYNPLHMDKEYTKKTQFKKQVSHGMLLTSFFSRLIGMHIPGKNALYFSQTINFRSPCFVNDVITVIGEVTEKRETTKMITVKTEIYNQNNVCLINGIGKVLVRD
jgi:acyl dehydratase